MVLILPMMQQEVAAEPRIREENFLLPVQIDGREESVEVFVARPANGQRLPIALIANGSAAEAPSSARADWLANLAHDFAHRGWLAASVVWPGYGRSTGKFMDKAGTCTAPDVGRFLDAHGAELLGALQALRQRPDVDATIALGIGFSIGGAAMLDLASRTSRPLTAVINISGGVYHYSRPASPKSSCEPYKDDLVRNFIRLGRTNPTPTLWLYAENDPFFPPTFASRLVTGYRYEGGNAEFFLLPAFEKDGHTLFKVDAYHLMKPHIDEFLWSNHLPTTHDTGLNPILDFLPSESRENVNRYRKKIAEKALAISSSTHRVFWNYGARSEEDAQRRAVQYCEEKSRQSCRLLATNDQLIDNWRAALTENSKH